MATSIESDGKQYLVTCDEPEKTWISCISQALGITNEAVIGAALNKGLSHYVEMLAEITKSKSENGHVGDTPEKHTGD